VQRAIERRPRSEFKLPQEIAGKRAAPKPATKTDAASDADPEGRRSGRARTGPKSYAEPSDRVADADADDSDESEDGQPAVTKQRAPPKRVKKEEEQRQADLVVACANAHRAVVCSAGEDDDADDAESSGSDILERFASASQSVRSPGPEIESSCTDFGTGVKPSKSPHKSASWAGWDGD